MIRYTNDISSLEAQQLTGFFEGWPNPPSTKTHLGILKASAHCWLAQDADSGQVVGFVTALSDGILSAYIPLLEVLPAYRNQGVGGALMRRMLQTLDGLYIVDLQCDAPLLPYYRPFGFRDATGAALRRYEHQNGLQRPEE